jgi:hypothetical protein
VEEALAIDKETNTSFWFHAIQKEMKNTKQAFQVFEENKMIPIGYKWIKCHLIFNMKIDFTRRERFITGGHMTYPPSNITYCNVVSCESMRIAFILAALNDVELLTTGIGNTCLMHSLVKKYIRWPVQNLVQYCKANQC